LTGRSWRRSAAIWGVPDPGDRQQWIRMQQMKFAIFPSGYNDINQDRDARGDVPSVVTAATPKLHTAASVEHDRRGCHWRIRPTTTILSRGSETLRQPTTASDYFIGVSHPPVTSHPLLTKGVTGGRRMKGLFDPLLTPFKRKIAALSAVEILTLSEGFAWRPLAAASCSLRHDDT
jgi:hypothetical protein